MDELIKRLRNCAETNSLSLYKRELMKQAAEVIEELRGFVQEAERDRDEYRDRLDKTNDLMQKRWIPVTERLPEDTRDVIAALKSRYGRCLYISFAAYENGVWYEPNGREPFVDATKRVTHWMPLPEPPKEG